MKKITLLLLVLFGIGLATSSIAASSDNPTSKAAVPACYTNVINKAPCNLKICIMFNDCNLGVQNVCTVVPAGGSLNIAAYLASLGYCCTGIIGITATVLPSSPPSPIVAPGSIATYNSGVAGPCNTLIIDYTTYSDCVIHP